MATSSLLLTTIRPVLSTPLHPDYLTNSLAPAATPRHYRGTDLSSCCSSINQSAIYEFFFPRDFVLRDVEDTPEFLKTDYIKSGYRVLFPVSLALKSFWLLHNETVNVWTHFVGLFIGLYLFLAETLPLLNSSAAVDQYDYIVFSIFYLSILLCFFASSMYHLLSCHGARAHSCLYLGDMSMIGCLIFGSYTPGLYYAFFCRDWARNFYIFVILFLALCYFGLQWNSRSIKQLNQTNLTVSVRSEHHWLRVAVLVLIVSFSVIPALHFSLIAETDHPSLSIPKVLIPLMQMLGLYFLGFIFYMSHFPERWYPRKFDILVS